MMNLKLSKGFTLAENLIILVIVGILAAIAIPNIRGMYNQAQVNQATNMVRGAMQEAQREAMRKSKQCKIKFDTIIVNGQIRHRVTNELPQKCLLSDRLLPQGVTLQHNNNDTINYGMKGNTTTMKTMRISAPGVAEEKCLVISMPLAIVRQGAYHHDGGGISASKCKKN